MAAKIPIHKRIQNAVDKIGTENGTKIPDAQLPADIKRTDNAAVNAFFDKFAAVKRYFILDTIKKHVEGQHKAAKKNVLVLLGIKEDALAAGDTQTYQFDTVNLSYKVDNGRALLNKEALMVVLMTQLDKIAKGARNLSLSEAQKVVEDATKTGKPPLTLIPATTAE